MSARNTFVAATLFLLPALLAVALLRIWPALLSFEKALIAPGETSYSLENFRFIFSDPQFLNSLKVTAQFLLLVNPLQVTAALLLALLLNAAAPSIGIWRSIIVLPIAIPPSVTAVVWGVMLRPDGPMNAFLTAIGVGPQRFLTSADQALPSIILIVSWVGIGYWMTFLLAGLQDIPRHLYEAAAIDGASRRQVLRYVTLPQLRRPITFVIVANTVSNFLVFAPVMILTSGGPQDSTDLIMHQIYTRAFISGDSGSAYAATVVLVAIVLVVVLVQFRLMEKDAAQ